MRDFIRDLADLINPGSNHRVKHFGSTHRNRRLYDEIMMIAPRFAYNGGINYDRDNFDWIIIPEYPLPRKWQEPYCSLLILPPSTYPDTPPIGFYINVKLHCANGDTDPHILGGSAHGAANLMDSGWYWYCVTISNGHGGWRPSADYRQPDNLSTFLNMVEESLTNDF